MITLTDSRNFIDSSKCSSGLSLDPLSLGLDKGMSLAISRG